MNKLVVILGPTASGKTDLAIKLAHQFNGEIVSADSRQIYKGMTIGTASPLADLQTPGLRKIKHHLLNFVEPSKSFSVADYQKLAIKAIKDIQKRGKTPFLVGGSAFYIYPIVEGWHFPKIVKNEKLRKQLEKKSLIELLKILKALDIERFKEIDKKNKRRVVRAVEIAKTLGRVPKIKKKPIFDCLFIGLKFSDEITRKRINQRVEQMIKQGLEKEVKDLVRKYGWTSVLQKTIGYSEWFDYFKNITNLADRPDLLCLKNITKSHDREILKHFEEELNLVKFKHDIQTKIQINTWRFSKRQMTWFKKDKNIHWLKTRSQADKLIKNFIKK